MNAREKAAGAKLRRVPEALFLKEAWRRGFERVKGRTWVPTDELQSRVAILDAAVLDLIDGYDSLGAVRAVRRSANSLREYLKIAADLERLREGGAK